MDKNSSVLITVIVSLNTSMLFIAVLPFIIDIYFYETWICKKARRSVLFYMVGVSGFELQLFSVSV